MESHKKIKSIDEKFDEACAAVHAEFKAEKITENQMLERLAKLDKQYNNALLMRNAVHAEFKAEKITENQMLERLAKLDEQYNNALLMRDWETKRQTQEAKPQPQNSYGKMPAIHYGGLPDPGSVQANTAKTATSIWSYSLIPAMPKVQKPAFQRAKPDKINSTRHKFSAHFGKKVKPKEALTEDPSSQEKEIKRGLT